MVTAATTQHSRRPTSTSGKKNDKRNGNARSKCRPPSGSVFFFFQNRGNDMFKFHNFYGNKAHKLIFPCSWLTGSAANSAHAIATAMHLSANAGLIF
jgi:hypothetical protein